MVVVRGPRLRSKDCDSPLAQVGETVDFKFVRGEMAMLEPRLATGTFLGRTDESDEVIVGTVVGGRVCSLVSEAHKRTNNGSVMHSRRS